jgi:hypothetical protein
MFINLWLCLSKYSLKADEKNQGNIEQMINFLVINYDRRPYLAARNMTLDELCSLLVSFSVLGMPHTILHKDTLLQVEKNVDSLDNQQLVQLLSVAKYISKYRNHSGKLLP